MWDWIKKAAGAALETGAEYLGHLGVIQQVMNAPSYEAAIQRLHQHIFSLENEAQFRLFMSAVRQQTHQAEQALQQARQNPSGESWGGSFEDRMAQRLAELRAGYHAGNSPHVQAAEKHLNDLGLLAQYAQLFWQERAAQLQTPEAQSPPETPETPETPEPPAPEPTPERQREAFQRHAEEILGGTTPVAPPTGTGPMGEIEAMQAVLDADRQLTRGMVSCMPGTATAETVQVLSDLHAVYANILARAPKDSTLVDPADLRRKMGQCLEFAGRACESLGRDAEALDYFNRAFDAFKEAGDSDDTARLTAKIRDLEIILSGDQEADIMALQQRLDTVARPSLDAVELLIGLGAAHNHRDDAFSAREHLHQAETMLQAMGVAQPGPEQLADALSGLLGAAPDSANVPDLTPIQTGMRIRGIYKQLYQSLSAAYRNTDPADPDFEENLGLADQYLGAVESMDSARESQAFSARAMAHLFGGGPDNKA
ncbi:hypothetical protein H0Z60_15380 [Ectothiorhodospiraceae bacterium WFHF3C12]|nr:hypothetical protein [Ectothiorhodospiraceae bacterium WFHF3C12]